jgi:hypothetical protein
VWWGGSLVGRLRKITLKSIIEDKKIAVGAAQKINGRQTTQIKIIKVTYLKVRNTKKIKIGIVKTKQNS